MAHNPFKAEKLAGTVASLVAYDLVLPRLFRQESINPFRGARNDTITFRVPGTLPGRTYAWRNDRSAPITFDEYAETSVDVSIGDQVYSAVHLTDEQLDMDFNGWATLVSAQTRGVGREVNERAVECVEGAPYEVELYGLESDLRGGILRARSVLNRFAVPQAGRVLVVGSDFEAALLQDEKLVDAQHVGSNIAESSLRDATIGRTYGFNIVVDLNLAPTEAYAFGQDAFIGVTAAPAYSGSAGFGATASSDGVAMRWIRDYDPNFLRDRSVVSTYCGFRPVVDTIRYFDEEGSPRGEKISGEHFVRGLKLSLEAGADVLPTGELAKITGVGTAGS